MTTEAEAKAKWCPFARQLVTIEDERRRIVAATSANRYVDDSVSMCIGSRCMAWRWALVDEPSAGPDPESGYCGLAR